MAFNFGDALTYTAIPTKARGPHTAEQNAAHSAKLKAFYTPDRKGAHSERIKAWWAARKAAR